MFPKCRSALENEYTTSDLKQCWAGCVLCGARGSLLVWNDTHSHVVDLTEALLTFRLIFLLWHQQKTEKKSSWQLATFDIMADWGRLDVLCVAS